MARWVRARVTLEDVGVRSSGNFMPGEKNELGGLGGEYHIRSFVRGEQDIAGQMWGGRHKIESHGSPCELLFISDGWTACSGTTATGGPRRRGSERW